ncbi:MAG: CRTAC1 family protein [Planctomycetota bacterium]|jgi:hypothetical protein
MAGPLVFVVCSVLSVALCANPSHAQTFVDGTSTWFAGNPNAPTLHASFGDLDNDGWVDLCAGGVVYVNEGGTWFRQLAAPGVGNKAIWGDYDNDGLLDLYSISNQTLHRNLGATLFTTDTTFPSLPIVVSRGAAWADFQNDGLLDMYVGGYEEPDYEPDVLLFGQGQGSSFAIEWTQVFAYDPARGVTCADFDNDGDQDVYVSNYRLEANRLWVNDGQGVFTQSAAAYGVAGDDNGYSWSYGHTIGSAWGDLDDDGYLDLFVGNFSHDWGLPDQDQSKFYRNRGPPSYAFEDMSATAQLAWQESYASPALGDYDNDGDLDLLFTTVYSGDNPVLYRNDGDWRFVDVTAAAGLAGLSASYQAAWADVDNDGDLDVMVSDKLMLNQGNANHWLKLRLDGTGGSFNRAAIGAQARVFIGTRTLTRQVEGGTGEGNQNDLTLHFGLGGNTSPVPVAITWPDGSVQNELLAVDQTVLVTPDGVVGSAWTNLGLGLAGTNGEPSLLGAGALLGGDPLTLLLSDAAPGAAAYLCIGFADLSAPFKGGTLVPAVGTPPGTLVPLLTDGAGSLPLSTSWPTGVPPSVDLYLQYWIADAGGPLGYSASNALRATTP